VGARVAAPGRRVAVCPVAVRNLLGQPSFRELWKRELRWSRCTFASRPLGHVGYALTFGLPLALAFAAVRGGTLGMATVAAALALRGATAAAVALETGDRARSGRSPSFRCGTCSAQPSGRLGC
jgi:hypothetical protein